MTFVNSNSLQVSNVISLDYSFLSIKFYQDAGCFNLWRVNVRRSYFFFPVKIRLASIFLYLIFDLFFIWTNLFLALSIISSRKHRKSMVCSVTLHSRSCESWWYSVLEEVVDHCVLLKMKMWNFLAKARPFFPELLDWKGWTEPGQTPSRNEIPARG